MAKAKRSSVLTTLVFTDIVGSTGVAEEMGDRRWRELLARHHRILRHALREHGGEELDTAGDGFFARFESPASAIRCAVAVSDAVRKLGIEIRAGVHIGECEWFDGTLSGLNVHAAARTMAEAGPGQIFVTSGVRDLVRGAGFGFADLGLRELRGIEGTWQLFEVISVDDAPRPAVLTDDEARRRRDAISPPPLVERRRIRLAALAAAASLVVAGAAFGLLQAFAGSSSAVPLTGCEVTTGPPLNDRSFNQSVFDGLSDAATTWGVGVRAKVTQSDTRAEFLRHMKELIAQRCSLIVTVGDIPAGDTAATAAATPERRFLVTDAPEIQGSRNLVSVVFRVDQAAFLAGYLAAGTSKTRKVATFGAVPIPTVIPFMNGFAAGVGYYNRVHGTRVLLLGWDASAHRGTFVRQDPRDLGAFDDVDAAERITAGLVAQGADIVLPVAGTSGEIGAGRAAQRSHSVLLIGVDSDQHFATPQYQALWLTSVLKIYRRMVYLAMGDVVHGSFRGGVLTGTVGNGGVDLAPYYGLGRRVPASLRAQLAQVKRDLANGSIAVAAPKPSTS